MQDMKFRVNNEHKNEMIDDYYQQGTNIHNQYWNTKVLTESMLSHFTYNKESFKTHSMELLEMISNGD